jgi:heat shock protein HslJ
VIKPAVAMLFVVACAEAQPTTPAPPPQTLMGTRWVALESDAPTLELNQNRATGNAGCNSYFAQVEVQGADVRFQAIGATRRMCAPEVMAGERSFLAALESAAGVRVEGDTLILADGEGTVLTRLRRR